MTKQIDSDFLLPARWLCALAAITLLTLLLAPPAAAQHEHHMQHMQPQAEPPEIDPEVGELRIPDTSLLDQDGDAVHFYSDLVEGKLVAINFIFTTCTTICPPMGANFARLQRMLGERAGEEVYLVSVSIDPQTDTPPRLAAWRARFGAEPDWTLVTGPKTAVDALLKSLKVFTPDPVDHTPILLVGNDRTGHWQRVYGLAPPDSVLSVIDQLAAEEGTATAEVGR